MMRRPWSSGSPAFALKRRKRASRFGPSSCGASPTRDGGRRPMATAPKAEIDEQARDYGRLPRAAEHTGGPPASRGSDPPMSGVLHGVRVVEVAQWWFVPAAGAVLADWGADVIKVEH